MCYALHVSLAEEINLTSRYVSSMAEAWRRKPRIFQGISCTVDGEGSDREIQWFAWETGWGNADDSNTTNP